MTVEAKTLVDGKTGELVPYQQPSVTLFGSDDPNHVVSEATRHAKALAKVVEDQKLYTTISGKPHVHVTAWTLLGSMTGVFPVEEGEAEAIEIDGVKGFKATVRAVTRSGEVVGRGTAYCMRDEDRWRGAKIHALASMAQTRATSKALKGPLGFIVKLAGFEPTPAEEMSDVESGSAQSFTGGTSAAPANAVGEDTRKKMERKVYALMTKLDKADVGLDKDTIKATFGEWYGTEKVTELSDKDLGDLIERLEEAEKKHGLT